MRARDNPFATARLEQLPFEFPAGMNWEVLMQRLHAFACRGALAGPPGCGKTTLLLELELRLAQQGFVPLRVRLDEAQKRFPGHFFKEFSTRLNPRSFVLFDGAEQLNSGNWNKFLRLTSAAGGLIITSHRPGLLPILLECRSSPELFRKLVENLSGKTTLHRLSLDEIYAKHHGNVRLALLEMYDVFAAMPP